MSIENVIKSDLWMVGIAGGRAYKIVENSNMHYEGHLRWFCAYIEITTTEWNRWKHLNMDEVSNMITATPRDISFCDMCDFDKYGEAPAIGWDTFGSSDNTLPTIDEVERAVKVLNRIKNYRGEQTRR